MSDPTPAAIATLVPSLRGIAIAFINAFRDAGYPAIITSGARSAAHNRAVGGVPSSLHLSGQAFDFGFLGYPAASIAYEDWLLIGELGEQLGLRWGGRFATPDVVHFDLGPGNQVEPSVYPFEVSDRFA